MKIKIENEFKIPGTDVVLKSGDIINVLNENSRNILNDLKKTHDLTLLNGEDVYIQVGKFGMSYKLDQDFMEALVEWTYESGIYDGKGYRF
jgi:hypothetical protein